MDHVFHVLGLKCIFQNFTLCFENQMTSSNFRLMPRQEIAPSGRTQTSARRYHCEFRFRAIILAAQKHVALGVNKIRSKEKWEKTLSLEDDETTQQLFPSRGDKGAENLCLQQQISLK